MQTTFLLIVEIIGTLAFAISGIRLAAVKNFDWFGAFIVGFVTAIGGGTLRDLMLGATPFWMLNSWYMFVSALALFIVIVLKRYLVRLNGTFFIFDTIGLGLFVVIGMSKTLEFGFSPWVGIIMGTITGAFGGVIRDILINEMPLVFRKDIYASACIVGGAIYWLCAECGFSPEVQQSACAVVTIAIRFLAVRFNWALPSLNNWTDDKVN